MKIKIFVVYFASCCVLASCGMIKTMPLDPVEQAYLDSVNSFPYADKYGNTLVFNMPKEMADDAWGRIQVYIEKWSDMKVSRITDYIIETYVLDKTNEGRYNYRAVRTPMDAEIKFEVIYNSDYRYSQHNANLNVHILAYYAKTGELKSKFIDYYGK